MKPVGPDPTPDPDRYLVGLVQALLLVAAAVGFFIGLAVGAGLA